VNVDVLLMSK